jgi:hypothetical protein
MQSGQQAGEGGAAYQEIIVAITRHDGRVASEARILAYSLRVSFCCSVVAFWQWFGDGWIVFDGGAASSVAVGV